MAVRNAWIAIVFAAAGLIAAVRPADACSCVRVGPACEAFWTTEAVFDGTVLKIEPIVTQENIGRQPPEVQHWLVTFVFHRGWKGVDPASQIEVMTARDGAACGYKFELGQRYLVFAGRSGIDPRRLTVSMCSATRAFEPAGESLQFLEYLHHPAKGGRVFGNITNTTRSFDYYGEHGRDAPIDAKVILRGPAGAVEATSRGGRYEFTSLTAGSYDVELVAPNGYETRVRSQKLEIPNGRACAQRDLYVAPASRIAGRVLEHTGAPFGKRQVEVAGATATPHPDYGLPIATAYTDADGFFELRGLPPGSYIVGVNLRDLPSQYNPHPRVVYPGLGQPAHVITIALGQAADLGTWQLPPPLPVVKIEGTITWIDDSPAAGVYVSLWDVTGRPVDRLRGAGGATSDANGRFVIDGRAGRAYKFIAHVNNGPDLLVSSPEIHTTGPVTVKLVARRESPR